MRRLPNIMPPVDFSNVGMVLFFPYISHFSWKKWLWFVWKSCSIRMASTRADNAMPYITVTTYSASNPAAWKKNKKLAKCLWTNVTGLWKPEFDSRIGHHVTGLCLARSIHNVENTLSPRRCVAGSRVMYRILQKPYVSIITRRAAAQLLPSAHLFHHTTTRQRLYWVHTHRLPSGWASTVAWPSYIWSPGRHSGLFQLTRKLG